uniref:MADF domain-containing protein n=1 Tax=Heliothis virescens TaxID=7102 RepID=A0A2A4K3A8_HELVI
MDVAQLIKIVRKHEFLYDQNHPNYRNPDFKNATWEFIGKEMNECSEACRLKWKTVRDGYIKYKKLTKRNNGTKVSNYVWSSQLNFLDNYKVTRRSFHRAKGTYKSENSTSEQLQGSQTPAQDDVSLLSPSPPPLVPLGSATSTETNSPFETNEELETVIETQRAKSKSIDSTDLLFLSYAGTFKKFSARQQALMKIQLAKLFANAELEQLEAEDHSSQRNDENFSTVVIKTEFDDVIRTIEVNPLKRSSLL